MQITPQLIFPEGENDNLTPEERLEAQRRANYLKRKQDEKLNPRFVLRGALIPGILIVVAFLIYAAVCYVPHPTRSFRNVFWIPHVIVGIALAWMLAVLIIDRLRIR